MFQINTSVPPPVKWNAINLMQLSKRAAEDQDRMLVDLQSAVDNFTDLHTCLLTASTNAKTPGLQSLINKQVLQLEGVMTGLWRVAGNHLVDFTAVQPKLLLESDQLDKHHSLDHDTNDDLDLNEIAFEENYCADDEEGSKDAIPEV